MPNSKDIPGSLDKICAGLFFRILLCGALILVALLFEPTRAYSRLAPIDPRDPYLRRTLTLAVEFKFDYDTTKTDTFRSSHYGFSQNYNMLLSGNIIDPRLIVYDTYVNYGRSTTSSGASNSSLGLGFSSTILRKFNYPIRIFEYRRYGKNQTTDSFGFRSLLRFERLPNIQLWNLWNRVKTDKETTLDSSYGFTMTKDIFIGPTVNTLEYRSTVLDNGSKISLFSIENYTRLSRTSRMNNALVSYKNSSTNGKSTMGFALTSSLQSKTSRKFRQNHNYTLYMSESESGTNQSKVDGQSYSGSWSYAMNKKANMGGSLSVSENNTDTASSKSEQDAFSANGSINYKLARNISVGFTSSYLRRESTITSGIGNFSGKESITTKISVGYNRKIRKLSFGSSYSFGYTEQHTLPDRRGGTGLKHNLNLSLRDLYYKKFSINSAASFARTDNLTGDIWSKSKSFSTLVVPGYWKRYGKARASYNYSSSDNWRTYQDSMTHNLNLNASSKSYRNTSVSASQHYYVSKKGNLNSFLNKSWGTSLSASHNRRFMGGKFQISGNYSIQDNKTEKSIEKTSTITLKSTYGKPLLHRIKWSLDSGYYRYKDLRANNSTQNYYISNELLYRLRAWFLQVRHVRTINFGDYTNKTTYDRFMLTLNRYFSRRF